MIKSFNDFVIDETYQNMEFKNYKPINEKDFVKMFDEKMFNVVSGIQNKEEMQKFIDEEYAKPWLHDQPLWKCQVFENYPEHEMDMVRLGIGVYGISKNKNIFTVASLTTRISKIRNIKKI